MDHVKPESRGKEDELISLFQADGTITANEVSDRMNISYDYAKKLIKRCFNKDLLTRVSRGTYRKG